MVIQSKTNPAVGSDNLNNDDSDFRGNSANMKSVRTKIFNLNFFISTNFLIILESWISNERFECAEEAQYAVDGQRRSQFVRAFAGKSSILLQREGQCIDEGFYEDVLRSCNQKYQGEHQWDNQWAAGKDMRKANENSPFSVTSWNVLLTRRDFLASSFPSKTFPRLFPHHFSCRKSVAIFWRIAPSRSIRRRATPFHRCRSHPFREIRRKWTRATRIHQRTVERVCCIKRWRESERTRKPNSFSSDNSSSLRRHRITISTRRWRASRNQLQESLFSGRRLPFWRHRRNLSRDLSSRRESSTPPGARPGPYFILFRRLTGISNSLQLTLNCANCFSRTTPYRLINLLLPRPTLQQLFP